MGKLALALVLVSAPATHALGAKDDAALEIGRIFADYDRKDGPGCSLGVFRDGEAVVERAFGMADLEHGVPLSPSSVFRTGSLGKQFTAFALLLAEQQGRLSLEDDVRTYLPELPPTKETITLAHLIHHTSGLRDYLTLMDLRGSREEDFYTEAEVMRALARSEHLNFPPGSEYLYSNTGYFLISQILPRATGMSLREFARKYVFEPLGMAHSHFHDDFREIVPNRAEGYRPREDGTFEIDMTRLNMVGDGGVFTTIEDLLLWDRNFDTGRVGGPELAARRLETGRLLDGTEETYAFGLRISEEEGRRVVSHDGAFVGFRTSMIRFPDEGLSVYVLCNSAAAEPGRLAREVASLYLPPKPTATPARVALPPAALERWAGTYFARDTGGLAEIVLEDRGLAWREREAALAPLGPGRFRIGAADEDPSEVTFSETAGGGAAMEVRTAGQRPFVYERVAPVSPGIETLARYVGLYRCEELDVTYRVELGDSGALELEGPSFDSALTPAFSDGFRWRSGSVVFERGPDGRPRGFELAAGRARNFFFERL